MWGEIQRFARCCKESKKQMGGDQFEQQKQTVISYLFPFCFCLPFLSLGISFWCTCQPLVHLPFLCYNNWTVHASAIAVYINVPTGVHPLAQIETHSLAKLEQCNKHIFSLGNCPDRHLFNIAFPAAIQPIDVLFQKVQHQRCQETSLNKEHQISHLSYPSKTSGKPTFIISSNQPTKPTELQC